jgi:sulfonate transport system permease protein
VTSWARRLLFVGLGLAVWEFVGQFDLVAQGALPGPSEILLRFWTDRGDYPPHILATLYSATLGFVIGCTVAILAGIVFVLSPATERVARGVNIALFALPPIVIVPILILTMSGSAPRITLAALGCYFPVMTATLLGLRLVDPRSVDVVRAYGGGVRQVLALVRWRSALPSVLGGLRVAAPNAVLGAILAEFGGGGRFGLGTYLIGSLGRADPARLWGIGLTATAIAALAYAVFALLASRATSEARAVTLAPSILASDVAAQPPGWRGVVLLVASLLLPFVLWWGAILAFGLPSLIAKSPADVVQYLVLSSSSAAVQGKLLAALAQTLPVTLLGLAAGLAFAFALAVTTEIAPALGRALLPIALVTQTMPLVALTPLLVLLLGRGTAVTIAITISVTFFPAFVTIAQGLALTPRSALDLVRAYGGGSLARIRLVAAPAALPHLFAAARLAAPRALLGVMIAEWLATGRGLGNLLNQSRGQLDYGMIWSVALVAVLVSMLLYQIVSWLEARTRRA